MARPIVGPSVIQEIADKIKINQERMLAAQNQQKSYANLKNQPMTFEVGYQVLLKVSS